MVEKTAEYKDMGEITYFVLENDYKLSKEESDRIIEVCKEPVYREMLNDTHYVLRECSFTEKHESYLVEVETALEGICDDEDIICIETALDSKYIRGLEGNGANVYDILRMMDNYKKMLDASKNDDIKELLEDVIYNLDHLVQYRFLPFERKVERDFKSILSNYDIITESSFEIKDDLIVYTLKTCDNFMRMKIDIDGYDPQYIYKKIDEFIKLN